MSGAIKSGSIVDGNREGRETQAKEKEFSQDETQQQIRENEDAFLEGLLAAADYAANEEMTFEINRGGKKFFSFTVTPLSEKTLHEIRRKYTSYEKNKRLGIKVAGELDTAKYRSSVIYNSTIDSDKEKIWDNKNLQETLKGKGYHIINALDVIEALLLPGEKEKIMEALDRLGGYTDDEDEGFIGDEEKRIETAKNL